MAIEAKKNKGALWATILGVVIYVASYFATGAVNGAVSSGAVAPEKIGMVNGLNGIFSQISVLGIVIMVIFDRKRGYLCGMALQIYGLLQVLIVQIIIRHNMAALPGAVTGIVSIIIYTTIYISQQNNLKMHDELTANYEQLIEQNHMIEAKDKALTQLAYYDRMTGLPNAEFFSDKLQEYIDNSTPFAVIHMDMDNFKQINDNFGHECGDELIKTYSTRFQKYCGDKYTCAKTGGDEFGMILPGKYTEADIMNIVEQLRALFAEPVQMAAGQFSITMSYGICGYPNDGGTPENLMLAANTALYNAKIAGKNRPCFYSQNSLG
jgi:diguanylate cyclase (GGDEF)-like protein